MDAYHLLLGRPLLYDNHGIYDEYANTDSFKYNGKSHALAHLPPSEPHQAKSGKGSKKIPNKSETREECATSKSKPQIALLMVKPNTSEGVEYLTLMTFQEFEDKIPEEPVPKVSLPIKMVLEESPHKGDQTTSDTTVKYDELELSCDEYVEILNELMRPRRAMLWCSPKDLQQLLHISEVRSPSTLSVFKPKSDKRHTSLMSMNFNPKDLRKNPSQKGEVDAY